MAPSNRVSGWAALLAEPAGPQGVYGRTLRLAREEAAESQSANVGVIAGVDEALAAVAALRDSTDCRDFIGAIAPLVVRIGRKLAMFPESFDNFSIITLLALQSISESVGSPLALPAFDIDRKVTDILVSKTLSPNERVTVALLLLDLGRPDDLRLVFLKGKPLSSPEAVALARVLAAALKSPDAKQEVEPAWEVFLRAFPSALKEEQAEWRQVLLAARLAFAKLGGMPSGGVAQALHRRVVALAEEESA